MTRPGLRWLWAGLLAIAVFIRLAEPLPDSEIFWRLNYGRQLVTHHSLTPDVTRLTWTTASADPIDCSWLGEIFYYLLVLGAGIPALFLFRYGVIALCGVLSADIARRTQGEARLSLYGLLALMAGYLGTQLKSGLFSFLFLFLLAWIYLRLKSGRYHSRLWPVLPPVLFLVWVNTDYRFAAGLLAIWLALAGEILNTRLSPDIAMSRSALRGMLGSTLAATFACVLNPYGPRYPFELLKTSPALVASARVLAARESISGFADFHFVLFSAAMLVVVAAYLVAFARGSATGGRLDWGLLLSNAGLAVLSFSALSTSFCWAPMFLLTCLFFESEKEVRLARSPSLAALALVGLAAAVCGQAIFRPYPDSFCGFGVSYANPLYEAEWVARFSPQSRVVYNDLGSGAYLAWRLNPEHASMIDSRCYPFRSWMAAYLQFERGQHLEEFATQIGPADLAVVSNRNVELVQSLLGSKQWALAFLGPVAGVYIKIDKATFPSNALEYAPLRFNSIRNLGTGLVAFQLALQLNRTVEMRGISSALQANCGWNWLDREIIRAMATYASAREAEDSGDLDRAVRLQEECVRLGVLYDKESLFRLYRQLMASLQESKAPDAAERIRDLALRMEAVRNGQLPPQAVNSPMAPPSPKRPATPTAAPTRSPTTVPKR